MATYTGGMPTVVLTDAAKMAMMQQPPDDPDPGPDQDAIDAEAMRLAGAIGLNKKGTEGLPVTAGLPSNAELSSGKITTGTKDRDFKAYGESVATISGWDPNATTRTVRTVKDTVVLYSNIDDPTDVSYSDYFDTDGTNEDGRDLNNDGTADEIVLTTSGDDAGLLTFTEAGFTVDKAKAAHFMLRGFTPNPSSGNSVELGPDDSSTTAKENERLGSFYGIEGKYTCVTGGCILRVTSKGALVVTGAVTFMPDDITLTGDDATKIAGVIPDKDYLVFGYWLEATTKDSKETYKFSPYATGELAYGATDNSVSATDVLGKATYEGPATGKYLQKTLTVDGGTVTGGSPFKTGQFKATAMLTANFGGNDVALSNQYTISGTISDFMDGDTSINENWTLMLKKSLIDTATGAWELAAEGSAATDTTESQGMTSGNTMHDGTWAAAFYGLTAGDNPETPAVEADFTFKPGSVAGTFNGHFQDGHVAGAFGASKQDD